MALSADYVQFGAGFSNPPGWLNFDSSPTLRVQRLPVVGHALARWSGNATAFPTGVRYGDIVRGLPLPPGTVRGLYGSHVLEHLSLEDMRRALRNCFALLQPGGVLRVIVPDLLQRAENYVAAARGGDRFASSRFMESTMLGVEQRPQGFVAKLRAMIGNANHLWMWDFHGLRGELHSVGFVDIRDAGIGDSGDPMFDAVEEESRFISGRYKEVALHAIKPNDAH